jgi:uncharacterized membrane protein
VAECGCGRSVLQMRARSWLGRTDLGPVNEVPLLVFVLVVTVFFFFLVLVGRVFLLETAGQSDPDP